MRRTTGRHLALVAAIGVIVATAIGIAIIQQNADHNGKFGKALDARPNAVAVRQLAATDNKLSTEDQKLLAEIAKQPTAVWVAGPERTVVDTVREVVGGARDRGATATLVAYNIPGRDCGSHSASGEQIDAAGYRSWIARFVEGLGDESAIVIVEPDAIAQWDCLPEEERWERAELLRFAVEAIGEQGSWAYLDAGHEGWLEPGQAAGRLEASGIEKAAGFALNVSAFNKTSVEMAYGTEISRKLGGKTTFIIDSSRNGGSVRDGEWCNPDGAALGQPPTLDTDHELVDALLWVKTPGNSDGPCNGGPPAGEWFMDYALELARKAEWVG